MDYASAISKLSAGGDEAPHAFYWLVSNSLASRPIGDAPKDLAELIEVFVSKEEEMVAVADKASGRHIASFSISEVVEASSKGRKLALNLFLSLFGYRPETLIEPVVADATLTASSAMREAIPDDTIITPLHSEILQDLQYSNDVLLLGPSASGKTVLAYHCALVLEQQGKQCWYLDINRPAEEFVSILISALASILDKGSHRKQQVILIDNVQGSAHQFSIAMNLLKQLSMAEGSEPAFLFIGWPEVGKLSRFRVESTRSHMIDPEQQVRLILRSSGYFYSDSAKTELVAESLQGDCFLAYAIARTANSEGELPTFDRLGDELLIVVAGEEELSPAGRDFLYVLSALSALEVYGNKDWVKNSSRVSSREMASIRGVRRFGDDISIGHRSKAFLLNTYLKQLDPTIEDRLGSMEQIVVTYCQSNGDKAILQTIERLEIPPFPGGASDEDELSITLELWRAFVVLRSRIVALAHSDPSWGDNTASVCFALTVLNFIDWDAWRNCYQWVTNSWAVTGDGLTLTASVAERDDFDAIRERMKEQDQTFAELPVYWERSDDVDFDRFHENWVLGLLLLAEGSSQLRNSQRIRSLLSEIHANVGVIGEIHPKRVPWVAARVLSGLSSVGQNIHTSDAAKLIASWLLTESPDGPWSGDHWSPGTGTWNDDFQATAMAITALLEAGVSSRDQKIQSAAQFLEENKGDWLKVGKEITVIDIVISQIRLGRDWRDFVSEIRFVLNWILSAAHWDKENPSVVASKTGIESSKLSQVSSRTLELIFEVLKSDLERIVRLSAARFVKISELLPSTKSLPESDERQLIVTQARYLEFVLGHLDVEITLRAEKLKGGINDEQSRELLKSNLKILWQKKETLLGLEASLQTNDKPLSSEQIEKVTEVCKDCFSEDLHDIFWLEDTGGLGRS